MQSTPKQIRDFLNKDNDSWYGSILEGILDTYQEDISIEEIDRLIKEEVQDFKQGYNEFCERN